MLRKKHTHVSLLSFYCILLKETEPITSLPFHSRGYFPSEQFRAGGGRSRRAVMTYPAWKQTDFPEESGRGYLFRTCSGEGARQPLSLGVWQGLKGRQGSGTGFYSGKRKDPGCCGWRWLTWGRWRGLTRSGASYGVVWGACFGFLLSWS